VQEAAVVGLETGGLRSRTLVHAVLVPVAGTGAANLDAGVAQANQRLEQHQRVKGYSIWPQQQLPRTNSTRKIRRVAIAAWVNEAGRSGATGDTAHTAASLTSGAAPGGASDWRGFLEQLGISTSRLEKRA